MEVSIDHADIVVTHKCTFNCKYCIDEFRNSYNTIVSLEDISKFLNVLKLNTNKKLTILLLGGEPTEVGSYYLKEISNLIHKYDYKVCMSTNGFYRDIVNECLEFMDWVQITMHNFNEIQYWSNQKYLNKINAKYSGDNKFTFKILNDFISATKIFGRSSVSMYFTKDFKELCEDPEVWKLLDTLQWTRLGSYYYAFYKGTRFKKCVPNETNIIDEPLIPKLYPTGVYNKTWCNEVYDPYLGEL